MIAMLNTTLFSMHFLLAFAISFVTLVSAFIYCHLSEGMTTKINDIDLIFYNVAWYELAISRQKSFIFIIRRTQNEFQLTGLGLVDCSLRVFTAVS